jgi:Bacterial extracellular solute-binding protein, family 7.
MEEAMKEVTLWETRQAEIINQRDMKAIEASGKVNIHKQTPGEREEWKNSLRELYIKLPGIVGPRLAGQLGGQSNNGLQ